MKIAILGFGKQGRSAYEYWRSEKNDITVCDNNEQIELPEDLSAKLGPDHLKDLDKFDLIVRSPIVHPNAIEEANSPDISKKVTTVTNEFFKVCPSKNIIGVTGTKGKGTTSTLIAKILEAEGKKVHLGGNIGIAPLDMLKNDIQPDDWVILELANFQLIDLEYSPPIAVCLMVVPEHMDWHEHVGEYINAKKQLFKHQKDSDTAIYFAENELSKELAEGSPGTKIPYYKKPGAVVEDGKIIIEEHIICSVEEIKLLGKHNWQNVCAAITATWQITQNVEAIKRAITSFTGMEHRLEFVRELDEVSYYDDSFGTTPETATVAIEAFSAPKIVILGGSDKGASFDQLAQTVSESNVRAVVTIGKTAAKIKTELEKVGFSNIFEGGNSMEEIVNTAKKAAQPGDIVLLSTGSASFGLFKDYMDRGNQFKKAVLELS